MRKIVVFTNISIDGFFEAPGHDISWFSRDSEAFSAGSGRPVDTFLFGHRTYDMMTFWGTPEGQKTMPEMAHLLTEAPKLVVSHAPFEPGWKNVRVISDNPMDEIGKIKAQPGQDIMIFGSNTLVVSLMQANLVDELQLIVNPIAFGAGTSIFTGLPDRKSLKLTNSRPFKSGAIMLTYEPVKS